MGDINIGTLDNKFHEIQMFLDYINFELYFA